MLGRKSQNFERMRQDALLREIYAPESSLQDCRLMFSCQNITTDYPSQENAVGEKTCSPTTLPGAEFN